MSPKLAIAIIMATVAMSVTPLLVIPLSVTHLSANLTKAAHEPDETKTIPSPDLWAGPVTQFFQAKLHGGHGDRFHFNVKRDTYQNLNLPSNRAANNMPVSSSDPKFLEPEKSAGQAGQAGATEEGGGRGKSSAL